MNTESILEEVLGHENINAAYLAVKANNGVAGVFRIKLNKDDFCMINGEMG